jgi:hypothetical protein
MADRVVPQPAPFRTVALDGGARAAVQPFRDWLTAEYRAADVVSALQPGLITMRADDKRADAADEKRATLGSWHHPLASMASS